MCNLKYVRQSIFAASLVVSIQISAAEWSGCYLGGSAGYGEGDNQLTTSFYNGNEYDLDAGSTASYGSLYGFQFGCDEQPSAKWVTGVQLSAHKSDMSGTHFFNEGTGPDNFVNYDTDQMLSITGKIGYLIKDSTLFYTKLGWIRTDQVYTDTDPGFDPALFFQREMHRSGWTAGLGIEHKFVENVSFFVEMNHADLGVENNILFDDLGEININDYVASIDQSLKQYNIGMNYYF